MAQYYYDQTERQSKNKRSRTMILLDTIMLLVSLALFAALSLTLVTSYFDPSKNWIFPILGLFTPAVYLASLLMALYWIIRWRWFFATTFIIPLAIAIPNISHYAKIETSKSYEKPSTRGSIKLMSYNVRGFIDDDKQVSVEAMNEFIDEQRPDIICFQEFNEGRMSEEKELALLQNYNRAKVKDQAIFTRFKILDSSENLINSDYDSGSGFWTDILIGSDTVRLYNLHLHSTTITHTDNEYISNMEFLSDSLSDDIFKSMLYRFKSTSVGRASQADSVANSIAHSPLKVIVCGDFNDTPNSYTFRKISKGLKDTFQEAGTGYCYTYRGFMNILRIDYILVDPSIEVLSYQSIDSIQLSDHIPITTTLKL